MPHADLIARLEKILREVSDDLASELDARYVGMLDFPSMKRRYDLDMSSVIEARAFLRALSQGGEHGS